MIPLAWSILFLPLAACLVITLVTLKRNEASAKIACGAVTASFVLAAILFLLFSIERFDSRLGPSARALGPQDGSETGSFAASRPGLARGLQPQYSPGVQAPGEWPSEARSLDGRESNAVLISLPGLELQFGVLLDRLSCLMLLIVTGVGAAIFFYSIEYMRGDEGYARYFACLSLFVFSMLGIVLATNFFQMFIFWELVGVSSYLLIGHWYGKEEAADAGKKAFLTTRVGDVGFLIGILFVWSLSGAEGKETLNFGVLEALLSRGPAAGSFLITVACLLIFCGVAGKSAQFPLHVWLPDAMEGPTPVSALIHAATMVAAGVYLLARTFFLFSLSSQALFVVTLTGAVTAFMAATMALVENDVKRILAYSTLSQLGLMVMAVGLGSSSAGMYHLVTHAFFKALLFLGAGCVIHVLHTQNIWEMGGLFRKMPVTGLTFLAGFLALSGIFPFSGFFSKDEILTLARMSHPFFLVVGMVTTFLTSVYMGRLFFTAFTARPEKESHPHDPSPIMKIPLVILSLLAVAGGWMGIGGFLHSHRDRVIAWSGHVAVWSLSVSLAGVLLSFILYGLKVPLPGLLKKIFAPLLFVLEKKYFVDPIYNALVQQVQQNFARFCDLGERILIVGWMVNGTARLTGWAGERIRRLQTGQVQFYALVFILGIALVAYYF